MNARTGMVLSIVLLALAGTLLYATRLDEVPAYIMHDEAQGALQAHAIATTGHDLTGRLLPLYFTEPEFPPGRDPVLIYYTAAALQVLPFTEAGVRIPTALIAVLNVILTFVVARRLFNSVPMGLLAGLLLLCTPVHFIRGRMILSPLYTIPVVLVWLWLLIGFVARPATRTLAGAAATLGFGCYTYLAAVVMMPLYLLYTVATAFRHLGRRAITAALPFALVLIPMVLWYATHPERNQQIVSAYQLDVSAQSPLARWIGSYWSFFDPSFLFITGDSSLMNSTRTAGFFPLSFAVLIPVGLVALVRTRQPVQLAIAGGLITAPLVSIISGAVEMNRVMFAIPFGVLTAAYGAFTFLQMPQRAARWTAIALLASVPIQFGFLYSQYMGEYRLGSASWFAGGAREALRAAMARAPEGESPIYISSQIEWVHRIWRFYAISDGRTDMIPRARYVGAAPADAPDGAIYVCPDDGNCGPSARWSLVESVSSLDGARKFKILRREGPGDGPQSILE